MEDTSLKQKAVSNIELMVIIQQVCAFTALTVR